jgi:hypothetical protein
MQAQYRREDTELHPTDVELLALTAIDTEAANVMRPPTETHVRAGLCHVRLVSQALPSRVRIAREADWIAMVAKSSPTRQNKSS